MPFLPSLQEAVQSHTGGFLFVQAEPRKETSSAVNLYTDQPIGRYGSLEAIIPMTWNNASGYRSLLEGRTWETEATSSALVYETLMTTFSPSEKPWRALASDTLTSFDTQVAQELGGGIFTSITWQPHLKLRESNYKLVLDILDFLLAGQVWQELRFVAGSSLSTGVQSLEQLYTFRQPTEVLHFLEEHSFLTPFLREAYRRIRNYFPSSTLFLEVVADPEVKDEEQLVVFIAVNQNPVEASEALDRLDNDWWLDAQERAQDRLAITLEFQ